MSTVPKTSEQPAENQNDGGGEYFEAPTIGEHEAEHGSDEHSEVPEVPDSEPSAPGASHAKPKKKRRQSKLPISPLAGEMSGRTEGGVKDRYRTSFHPAAAFFGHASRCPFRSITRTCTACEIRRETGDVAA